MLNEGFDFATAQSRTLAAYWGHRTEREAFISPPVALRPHDESTYESQNDEEAPDQIFDLSANAIRKNECAASTIPIEAHFEVSIFPV
jgi:hypothetical protein